MNLTKIVHIAQMDSNKIRILRRGVIEIGDLHIYQIDGMEEYLPKKVYYGNAG